MFTGIVAAVGRIVEIAPGPAAARVVVDTQSLPIDDVAIGDSIAVNGCCLTVVALETAPGAGRLSFDVSSETLACTVGLAALRPVNLEKALRLADRLGGHLMTGHVDGAGTVAAFDAVQGSADAGSRCLAIDVPPALARYVAAKGSIAVDGVSLTVNRVQAARFDVNLIPHTLSATTLGELQPGDRVNLEIDLMARYAERLLVASREIR